MTFDPKDDLRWYLQRARAAMVWKLDGLCEYDARRPPVPAGTNLPGLIKHLTGVEFVYFGTTFGRPSADEAPWSADDPRCGCSTTRCGTRGTRISSASSSTARPGSPRRASTCPTARAGGREC